MRTRLLQAALVALAVLAVPALASASTLNRTAGNAFTYTGSGSINGVQVTASAGSFNISDSENITLTGTTAGCTGSGTINVACPVTPTSISIDSAGGNDSINLGVNSITAAFPLSAQGGSGNDNVTVNASFSSGSSTATIDDTSGDDNLSLGTTQFNGVSTVGYGTVSGGPGNDTVAGLATVNGDANNDILRALGGGSNAVTLNGGTEDDTFQMNDSVTEIANGGSGTDTSDWTTSSGAKVSLDAVANDGGNGSLNDNANADGSVEIVRTGQAKDDVTGSNNNDTIFAGDGNDSINGAGGDDFIDGEGGADSIAGGANGVSGDTIDYSRRAGNIRVTLDAAANDGEANENDNVGSDVENINGGFGGDSITGSTSANTINGGAGDDSIDGLDGTDTLLGGSGNDSIDGGNQGDAIGAGRGDDSVDGGPDNDTINGDGGADLVDGSSGTDSLNGNAGSDTILAKDGQADTVNCGEATDHAVTDLAGDSTTADCEITDTGAAGFGDPVAVPPVDGTVGGSVKAAVVTCVPTRGKQRRVVVKCTVALSNAKLGKLHAKLLRGKRQVARTSRSGSGTLTLRTARKAKAGRYAVVFHQGAKKVGTVHLKVR
jgi:Ca2+-binding RTX toxin-like protein